MLGFNRRKLQAQMVLKGVTGKDVAKKIGVTEPTLYRKMNNNGDFTRNQIGMMIEFLDITDIDGIFFADDVAETQ